MDKIAAKALEGWLDIGPGRAYAMTDTTNTGDDFGVGGIKTFNFDLDDFKKLLEAKPPEFRQAVYEYLHEQGCRIYK